MDFLVLEKRLGVKFQDRSLLKQALTHRSYLNENRSWPLGHNERLEFLGDAVLELIVTDFLFKKYPTTQEGLLTAYRTSIVNNSALFVVANELGLGDFLLMSRGEAKDTGRARQHILSCAVEAIIGALYTDQGYANVHSFVATTILSKADKIISQEEWRDPKSRLQEVTQRDLQITPVYQVIEESGLPNNRQFIIGVYFGSNLIAQGQGASKKLAEAEAAQNALNLKEQISS